MYRHTFGGPVMEELLREDVTTTIDHNADEELDRAQLARPPVDVLSLAQNTLGMLVCLDRRQPQRGRAQRTGGRDVIYLKPEEREERHQWTVAHEIGEHFKV